MTEDNITTKSSGSDVTKFEIKNNLQQVIVDVFSLFTADDNINIISITHLSKVIRHLGCVPSEEELNEFINIMENQNETNIVDINIFVPHMENQIRAFRYKPATADELLQAFQTLDTEGKGSLSVEFMQQALREGDSLATDEIAEAIKSAYDPDFKCIHYDMWIHKLLGKTRVDPYAIAVQDEVLAASRQAANDVELNRLLFDDNNEVDPAVATI